MDTKGKILIGGFVLFAGASTALSVSMLFGDKGTDANTAEVATSESGKTVWKDADGNEVENPTEGIDPFVTDRATYTPETKRGKEPESYPEETAETMFLQIRPMLARGEWDMVEELLRPVLTEYDLTEGDYSKRLTDIYSDVTTMQALVAKDSPERMSALYGDFNDPDTFILAPLFFPQKVWYDVADDVTSLMLSQRGEAQLNGVEEIPAYVPTEDGAGERVNPRLAEDPFIQSFLNRRTEAEFYKTFYIYDLTVRGVPIHGYSVRIGTNDNRLIGYYPQPNSDQGTFQTIAFYLEHRRDMTDAAEDNWEKE